MKFWPCGHPMAGALRHHESCRVCWLVALQSYDVSDLALPYHEYRNHRLELRSQLFAEARTHKRYDSGWDFEFYDADPEALAPFDGGASFTVRTEEDQQRVEKILADRRRRYGTTYLTAGIFDAWDDSNSLPLVRVRLSSAHWNLGGEAQANDTEAVAADLRIGHTGRLLGLPHHCYDSVTGEPQRRYLNERVTRIQVNNDLVFESRSQRNIEMDPPLLLRQGDVLHASGYSSVVVARDMLCRRISCQELQFIALCVERDVHREHMLVAYRA